jgi:hypothetical protein
MSPWSGIAHAAGVAATHVNHLGLSGKPEWALAQRIAADEFRFVTNNRADCVQLFRKIDMHLGLIVLIPNVAPALQRALFQALLVYLGQRDLVNTVIEVSLERGTVTYVEYQLPPE